MACEKLWLCEELNNFCKDKRLHKLLLAVVIVVFCLVYFSETVVQRTDNYIIANKLDYKHISLQETRNKDETSSKNR